MYYILLRVITKTATIPQTISTCFLQVETFLHWVDSTLPPQLMMLLTLVICGVKLCTLQIHVQLTHYHQLAVLGYQQAYTEQQCTANPLYSTVCSGYADSVLQSAM